MEEKARIEEIKGFLRIDGEEEDKVISSFFKSAKQYLSNAGIAENEENELYKLAVNMLVCGWYENRDPIVAGSNNTQSFALKSIITQLKCSQTRG